MPYPTPHITNISLLHEVPLDASYKHTIYFASASAQHSYFAGKVVSGLTWSDCMYHRERSAIRVNAPIENCEEVNYVMFQNTAYGTKWFYAFVMEHTYINANCTELKIQLDVMQTWYFDYTLPPCYIERQHNETDAIGDNLVSENLDIGDPVAMATESSNSTFFSDWSVIAISTFDWATWQPSSGGIYNGVYSALKRTVIGAYSISRTNNALSWSFTTDPGAKIQDLITNHADLVDGLVAVFLAPSQLEASSGQRYRVNKPTSSTVLKPINAAAGYTPRNRKLYTFPFTKLYVTDGSGSGKFYAFEHFANATQADFMMFTDRAPAQSVMCTPIGYKGYSASGTDGYNFEESIIMTGFPQVAWISSAFQTYLAQNASSLGLANAMAIGKTVVGGLGVAASALGALPSGGSSLLLAGGAGSMLTSGIKDIINQNVDKEDKARQAPTAHGQVTGSAMFSVNEKAFRFTTYAPRPEYCQIIDGFFDLYGYAQHKVATPNVHARPHWTYIKTVGCLAKPASGKGCPAGDLAAIQNIYDNGITFWVNGSDVGDYSLNNSV